MIKVLISGGAGYLGSILTERLLSSHYRETRFFCQDVNITVIDNFMYHQYNSLLHLCSNNKFNVIKGDVRDERLLKDEIKKYDVIIPLAAIVGMPSCKNNPKLANETNYESIKNILELKSDNQLLLYPNTNSGYGQGDGAVFTEESELNPISVYGVTKVKSEKIIKDNNNTVVFRLATIFGVSPKMRLDLLVNDFAYRAWWDGFITLFESHFKRNYVYISDVADLFIWSINNWEKVKNEVFNFGLSNANLNKEELCLKIKEYIPSFNIVKVEGKKDPDQRNYIVLNDKIEQRGFAATTSIDTGIKELLRCFSFLQPQIYSNLI